MSGWRAVTLDLGLVVAAAGFVAGLEAVAIRRGGCFFGTLAVAGLLRDCGEAASRLTEGCFGAAAQPGFLTNANRHKPMRHAINSPPQLTPPRGPRDRSCLAWACMELSSTNGLRMDNLATVSTARDSTLEPGLTSIPTVSIGRKRGASYQKVRRSGKSFFRFFYCQTVRGASGTKPPVIQCAGSQIGLKSLQAMRIVLAHSVLRIASAYCCSRTVSRDPRSDKYVSDLALKGEA